MKNLQNVFENANNHCLKQLRFIICSAAFPMCSDEVSQPIYPCRNQCEMVFSDCADDPSLEYWKSSLNCEQFPQNEKSELCLKVS